MNNEFTDQLSAIIGRKNVHFPREDANPFLKPGIEAPDLIRVKPATDAELADIIKLIYRHNQIHIREVRKVIF